MFKSSHMNKEEWDMYVFYPEENDKFEKVFKDACWEKANMGERFNEDNVRTYVEWNNRHYLWIAKDSEWNIETFVDDMGFRFFDDALDICWEKWEDKTEINEDSDMFWYDEDYGWRVVENEYKMLMY